MATFTDYINAVQSSVGQRILKLELLDSQENVISTITPDLIGGDLQLSNGSGARRNCNLSLENADGTYIPSVDGIWINSKFRLYTGYKVNGEDYFISRGIFVIGEPQVNSHMSEQTVDLQLYDKWCLLNGELGGTLEAPYIVPLNTIIEDAVRKLFTDAGEIKNPIIAPIRTNIFTIDSTFWEQGTLDGSGNTSSSTTRIRTKDYYGINANVSFSVEIDSNYEVTIFEYDKSKVYISNTGWKSNTQTFTTNANTRYIKAIIRKTDDSTIVNTIINSISFYINNPYTPYTLIKEAGSSYADILTDLAKMISYEVFYDSNGYPRFQPPTSLTTTGSTWDFSTNDILYLGSSRRFEFTKVKNYIKVIGDNINGATVIGLAQDTNITSSTRVALIGKKTEVINDDLIYSLNLANARANFELLNRIQVVESINLECVPIDIIQSGDVITIEDSNSGLNDRYLVTGVSFPLLNDGNQTITCWKGRTLE